MSNKQNIPHFYRQTACFRKSALVISIALGSTLTAYRAGAAMDPGSTLLFNPGVSYFGVDYVLPDGFIDESEKTYIDMNQGIILGVPQPPSGSHPGPPDGTESPTVDIPWEFFGGTGMQGSSAGVTVYSDDTAGSVELDFTSWFADWNSALNPLGGDPLLGDTGLATVTCANTCEDGDTYTLSYSAHPTDPSPFQGIYYELHLEGTISAGVGGCTPVTTLTVHSGVLPYAATAAVNVTTSAALAVGSSDLVMNFDPAVMQAVDCSSNKLSSFVYSIDNAQGTIATASATSSTDQLSAADELFSCTFQNVGLSPAATTTITLSDGDGDACNDLAGPVPPIPPQSLPYDQVQGVIQGGELGDVDCDGVLSPIDASVILGLFVGTLQDSDLPAPCDDPAHRVTASDWDLSGTLNPIDASVTLGVDVYSIDPYCDTPLGNSAGLCGAGAAAMSASTTSPDSADASISSDQATLEISTGQAQRNEATAVDISIMNALNVGSTGLSIAYNSRALDVVSVESSLGGFVYRVDTQNGVIHTASASVGQNVAAGDTLMTVTFHVKDDARRGRHQVRITGDSLIGGAALNGQMPVEAAIKTRPGFVLVR